MKQVCNKDKRWAKQFGDFSESLTMYVLGQLKNMKVALIDHVGADLIATKLEDTSMRYAISVKGRNIPESESKSFNFSQDNISKLEQTAKEFGMVPAVSFVFVDDMEGVKKIRMFVATLSDLKCLSDDGEVGFINWSSDGLSLRYTEGKNAHRLTEIKDCNKIAYFEMQFNFLTDVDVF